jgi:hypothetical protein
MTFLAGTFIGGLALGALPVIIHLFARRRRKIVPWGAMQFLSGSPPRFRRRLLRLNELLVLLLRVLAVVALVLAFARPVIPMRGASSGDEEVVLILDASLSTARRFADGEAALKKEAAAANSVIARLADHSTVRLLLATDAPRWLTPAPVEITETNRAALRSMLATIQPTLGGSDIPLAIGEALASPSDRAQRRIVIVSDATERPWHADDAARWASLARAAKDVPIESAPPIPAPDPATLRNLSLDRLTPEHDTIVAGDEALLTAEIRNRSMQPSDAAEISWRLDGREVARGALPRLEANAATTLEFALPIPQAGSFVASCAILGEDDLPLDNSASAAIRAMDELPILIVESEPDRARFLTAALAGSVFRARVIAPSEFPALELRPFVCLIFGNFPPPAAEAITRLTAHVANGAGIWLALGEQTDPALFNRLHAGLSPCDLAPAVGDLSEFGARWRVLLPDAPHPATMLLRDTARLDLDAARVARHLALAEPRPPHLTALLTLESQAPLVIEHTFGRGRVLLQTVPLDRSWSNLPILQSYVPIVREFAWWLAQGRVSARHVAPGETLRVPVEAPSAPFTVRLPDGSTHSDAAQQFVARFSSTSMPGIYDIESGAQRHEYFSVARAPEESDLAPMRPETRALLAERGVNVDGQFGAKASKPIAAHLLALALGLFVAEALLAWLLGRQRNAPRRAVEMRELIAR